MLRTDFSYHLPEERIAQTPLEPRDQSRLLQLHRSEQRLTHHVFADLPSLLQPGDLLIRNNTKVLPARLFGQKTTGGRVEVLLTKRLSHSPHSEEWLALTRPGLKKDQVVQIGGENGITVHCLSNEGYARRVQIRPGGPVLLERLARFGELPTPPYIHEHPQNQDRYQTVFAQEPGSAAAPTAGLHFTPPLLDSLSKKGVHIHDLTLHVGLGTFLPVKVDTVADHHMHSEWYELPSSTAAAIAETKARGNKVIAVGTTSLRALESAAAAQDYPTQPLVGETRDTSIFITPPYQFRVCDGLITNFHLPESTLLMLVSAFTTAPQTNEEFSTFQQSFLGNAYRTAIAEQYRFFSFGDAMLIL